MIRPPLVKKRLAVVILISPPLPTAFCSTSVKIELGNKPSGLVPSTVTDYDILVNDYSHD
ncbi:MAG: hypothetical protein QNJ32_31065 [Xenococcaceae cyanobacterium MO_167.B27]|nr:hypothetical protein [Xenococcaceae cyanobacterium MO_167.B27]